MRNKGFSLIEMVIVLVLISLSIALVTPSLSRFSKRIELRTSAQKVSGILRFFRSEAVQKGRVFQVLFDPDTRVVRARALEGDDPEKEGKEEPKIQEKRYFLPSGIQMREVKIPSPEFPSDLPTIEFYPHGGSNGGTILLEMQGEKGYRIQVHFLTGMVEIGAV
jgi:general secretion pathway protein H